MATNIPRSLHRRPPMTSLTTPSLLLLVPSLLAIGASGDDDQVCLTHLYQSLQDPLNRLTNWTTPTFAAPCTGFTSHLYGATCNNGRVYKLSLSNLSLRGAIPPNLSLCTSLQSLDLSSNRLSGPIPPDFHSLLNLALLNLSSNLLSGTIPTDLALCAYLNVIDLHSNLLSGTIPPQLGLLARLSVFDVSYNLLEGEIPASLGNRSGMAVRFNASSFAGNKGLYGYPLGEGRGGAGAAGGLSVMAIVGIGLGSGLASLIISFAGVCIWLRFTERRMAMEEGKIAHLMPEY